eukprot:Nitzschia sp. Nitz4//scaffold328_size19456//5090//6226//NITZ4_008718-RA/size19456-processed-gene-0.9-mRNA-1//1//CDS//3329547965//4178//frame0
MPEHTTHSSILTPITMSTTVSTGAGRGALTSYTRPTPTSGLASSRRGNRFSSRAAASKTLQSIRAPIVLELGSTVIRVGYADASQPQHLIPVPSQDKASSIHHPLTESQWYNVLSPWIDLVYDRLFCTPSTRKVVILHSQYLVPQTWMAALEQILWNKSVPAVTFVSALAMVPVAHGWKRGMIVHVGRDEAVCVCHADGHMLPFTYQSVLACGYQSLLKDPTQLQREWTAQMDSLLLDRRNPESLLVALLKCLDACPRDIRYDVINNIMFCGDGVMIVPDLARRVGQRLEQLLEGQADPEPVASEEKESTPSDSMSMTAVPVSVQSLLPLGSRLRLLSTAPYRPDMLSWVACSLWASTWTGYDEEESRILWKVPPSQD